MTTRKTTQSQNEILKLLYKFRYANSQLLATHRNISTSAINKTLTILLDKKFIGRNYNQNYKLVGRGAEYYLTNAGIRYLRDTFELNKSVLHAMYKNKSLGQPFIQKCLLIYQIYLHLRNSYGKSMKFYTRSEIQDSPGFIEPLPDLYLTNKDHDYFLDIFTDTLFFYVKKRIDTIISQYESIEGHPLFLLVLPDSRTEAKAQAYIEKMKDDNYIEDDELIFMLTTQKALFSDNKNIWSIKDNQLAQL